MEMSPAAVNWDVGSTEDVVNALMDFLVGPRLPRSNDPPSEDTQKSVAKQMHAVVLLYNYYHRKQNLDLEFLGFRPFCRLIEKLRPSVSLFMKFTKESSPVDLNDAENQLSATEKAINNACNIAESLDASKDAPVTEGLPVSKVSVLVIDAKKDNCFLKYGKVTEGVWCLVEKDINESSVGLDIVAEQLGGKRRKTDNGQTSSFDTKLLQIAYEAVQEATGIPSSDLGVLEAHVVHSLSKEKSAAQFFMMLYNRSFDIANSVPLEELVESLQGPLVEVNDNIWSTTRLVEYHHLLPYVGFISSWLPRKDLCSPLLYGDEAQGSKNYDKRELRARNELGQFDTKSSSADNLVNENREKYDNKRKYSSADKVESTKESGIVKEDFKDIRDLISDKKGNKIDFAKPVNSGEIPEGGYLSEPSRGRPRGRGKNKAIDRNTLGARTRSSIKDNEGKSPTPRSPVRTRRKNATTSQHDGVHLMEETGEPLKSNDVCMDEKMTADYGDANISCNQNGIAATENPLAESETLNNIGVQNATASAGLRKSSNSVGRYKRTTADNPAAKENPPSSLHNMGMLSVTEESTVALLDKRSQELSSQARVTLDEQVVCEYIAARIRRGGEFDLADRCLRHILGGKTNLLLNEVQVQDKGQTKTRLILPGKSSYQDLELICRSNTLGLPRYTIYSSDVHPGKFLAEVTVQINGLMLRSTSGPETSPDDARESCAAQMITRISDSFS